MPSAAAAPSPALPRTHEEYVAVFDSVKWESKDPENPFIIAQTSDRTTVKGPAFGRDFARGRTYKFCGKWTSHPKFGRQFEFVVALEDQPHDLRGCVAYLLRALKNKDTGIGEKTAARMFAEYGSDCVRMLREKPKQVAAAIGIDMDACLTAAQVLAEDAKDATIKIELLSLFDGKGFPRDTIAKCIEVWGPRAPNIIRRDAFQLLTSKRKIPGAGFKRVDKLFLDLGGHPAKLKRQALCAWHACKEAGDHTWHASQFVIQAIKGAIGGVDVKPAKALQLAVRAGWLVSRMEGKQELIAIAEQAKNEADVAEIAARLVAGTGDWPEIQTPAEFKDGELSPHQLGEILTATSRGRLGILAGTPGTGKTFSAAQIILAAIEKWGEGEVAVAAPTGKAAVRINEAMQDYGIRVKATTIHSLLGPDRNGHGSGDWSFRHNRENPIPCRLVVIDESSMIETDLAASLFRAIGPSTHVLLIGDPYQLPPVGHGAPLRDLIKASAPAGELTEVRRNAGMIVEACRAIKECERIVAAGEGEPMSNVANLKFVPCGDLEYARELLEQMYGKLQERIDDDDPERTVSDLKADVQLIVAMNEKSQLSRNRINDLCQQLLNPGFDVCDEKGNKKHKYRTGDKAVCLSNGQYAATDLNELTGGKHRVCNGEVGIVAHAGLDYVDFRFDGGDDGSDEYDRHIRVAANFKALGDFDLGYALTCHKCQGSEWPVVVIFADPAANRFARKEWWYTAISRAKARCLIFGVRAVAERQAKTKAIGTRRTRLKELFQEALAAKERPPNAPPPVDPPPIAPPGPPRRQSLEQQVDEAFDAYFAANPAALGGN
jgi:exodeoxyribonuclease V alpha subunit